LVPQPLLPPDLRSRLAELALVLSLLPTLLSCNAKENQGQLQTLHRGISGEPSTLIPSGAVDTFSIEVLRDLYEGLTTDAPNGDVVPGVASSWDLDPAGITYTFHLRPNALWSNGKPVRASDFVIAWERIVDPKYASPIADDLRVIAGAPLIINGLAPPSSLGVFAAGDQVLIVKLSQPTPYFLQILTHPSAYPIYSDPTTNTIDPKRSVSNGPYVLSAWAPGTKLNLVRNEQYWDRSNVHVPNVEYQIADENSQFARYRSGQLDMTDTVPPNAVRALQASVPNELLISPFLATAYYGLNLKAGPLASNLLLRQSLAMAINRKQLAAQLMFGQVGAYGFVPPGTWNYSPQSWAWKDEEDAERVANAKRFFAAAGYTTNTPLHLRLLFNSDAVIKRTAIMVASMWKDVLGIDVELTEEEYRVFLQSRRDKSRWDVVRLGWTADYNDASNFLDIFREQSSNNDSGFKDTSYDAQLDEAARTADPVRRRTILEASERQMLMDYPVIPLYFFVSKRLIKPYVEGVNSNPLNQVGSKSLTIVAH